VQEDQPGKNYQDGKYREEEEKEKIHGQKTPAKYLNQNVGYLP
jgi:hypothetical protein